MQTMQFLLAGVSYSVHIVLPCHEGRETSHRYRAVWLICPEEADSLEQAEELLGLKDIAQKFNVCMICVKEQDLESSEDQIKDILKPLWFYIHRNLPISADPKENYIVGIEKGAVMVLKLGMKYGNYYHTAGVLSAKPDKSLEERVWLEDLKKQENKIRKMYLAWGMEEETCQFYLELDRELRRIGVKVVKAEASYEDKWQFWSSQIIQMLPMLDKNLEVRREGGL